MRDRDKVYSLIRELYVIVDELKKLFPSRKFTPDGHLVGSLGEVLAAGIYDLELLPDSTETHDARTPGGKLVQVKATQGRAVSIYSEPEHLIVMRLARDGSVREIYNGPGVMAWSKAGPVQKNGQRRIYCSKLEQLMSEVPESERLPVRADELLQ